MSSQPAKFSRRERQIMDVIYARGEAAAAEIGQADGAEGSALEEM